MQIDPSLQSKASNYKVLTNLIVPRPIAWVSTVSRDGVVNLAPFSFFNAVCADPLYVVVSIGPRDNGAPKDTALNIATCGEFVVNLVTEDLLASQSRTRVRCSQRNMACGTRECIGHGVAVKSERQR